MLHFRSFNITENSWLETPFSCHADAYPPAEYYWIFDKDGESTIGNVGSGMYQHGVHMHLLTYKYNDTDFDTMKSKTYKFFRNS